MGAYVDCPYTPDEWRDILKSAQSQLLQMQSAVNGVRTMERRATAGTPGYDLFPIDDDANAVMQTLMNSKWGNVLGDIGSAASLALFRYKYRIAAGKPAAFTSATFSDWGISDEKTELTANDGTPFNPAASDKVTVVWTSPTAGLARSQTGLIVDTAGGTPSNSLYLTTRINPDLVVNGVFAADTNWTKGAGWTIAGGVADAAGALNTPIFSTAAITVVAGARYELSFTMTRSAGDLQVTFDAVLITTKSAGGTYAIEFTPADASGLLAFIGVGFTGTLDNVILREKLPSADTTVTVELEATYVP